jgi:hypothetical protein
METINRSAITIKFKEKFLDWVNNLPDRGDLIFTMEMLNEDPPAYLMPAYENDDAKKRWFNKNKIEILEEAFESICTEPTWWPQVKSPKEFDEYLSVEFHSMVWDMLEDKPLERDS